VELPALARTHRLGAKASRAGFDWNDPLAVREKLSEELKELDREIAKGDFNNPTNAQRLSEELGDLLATVVNLARHLGLSAEKCLQGHNQRFTQRITRMEEALRSQGRAFEDANMDELEELWQKSKRP
jgi:ATP diphosphatase